jgi:general secretion pathway protein N
VIWLRRGAVALLVYVIFLLMTLPAALLLRALPLPNDLVLQGVDGTVWDGQVAVVRDRRMVVEQVNWQLSPWSLLLAEVRLQLKIGNRQSEIRGQAELVADLGGISIYQGHLELPAKYVSTLAKLPARSNLSGRIIYDIKAFEHGLPWCNILQGNVYWQDASFSNRMLKQPVQLGLFRSELSCDQGQVVVAIDGSQSPLKLNGELRLPDQQRVVGSLLMQPSDELPKDVREGLMFLTEQTDKGMLFKVDSKLSF